MCWLLCIRPKVRLHTGLNWAESTEQQAFPSLSPADSELTQHVGGLSAGCSQQGCWVGEIRERRRGLCSPELVWLNCLRESHKQLRSTLQMSRPGSDIVLQLCALSRRYVWVCAARFLMWLHRNDSKCGWVNQSPRHIRSMAAPTVGVTRVSCGLCRQLYHPSICMVF